MGQAKEKEILKKAPLLREVATGESKTLFATNFAYLEQFNLDLATAVKQQSSFNEVFVIEYSNREKFLLTQHLFDLLNGLMMHCKISEELGSNQMLERAMKLLPLKGKFIFEADTDFLSKFDLVKEGTPLVNNTKSGYVPSITLLTNVLNKDKSIYHSIDADTAISLQILDVNSNEMMREFGVDLGKMLKPLFSSHKMNLISGEFSIGIDLQNNMRLVDVDLTVKDLEGKTLSYKEITTILNLK